eukprot:5666356-Alexandrium_andersonii.AAC.1
MRVPGSGPGLGWGRRGRGAKRPRRASGGARISVHPQVCVSVYRPAQWPAANQNHRDATVWRGPR